MDEYEIESKRRITQTYNKIPLMHRYFQQDWIDGIINRTWSRERVKVNDIFEDTKKLAKRAIKEGVIISSKLKGENNIVFPHPLAFMLKDLGYTLETMQISISNQNINSHIDFEELMVNIRKKILARYNDETSNKNYFGLLHDLSNVENQLFSIGIFLKVLEILKLLETNANFVPKNQKYVDELLKCDYTKFFSNLCEILAMGSFLKKGVLFGIEVLTAQGKRPDLLVLINGSNKIELEIYAPGKVTKIENGATQLFEGEIYSTPFYLNEKDTFEKIKRKLDGSQLSGQYPGILVIDSTFSQKDPKQFSDAFLSIIHYINTNSLSSHPFINFIPAELSSFILIDRRRSVKAHYYPIPNAKNKIEKDLKLIIDILN